MYGTSTIVSLPVAGSGAAMAAGATDHDSLMAWLIAIMAAWTLLMLLRSLNRLVPREER